jgi:hypothetical protein
MRVSDLVRSILPNREADEILKIAQDYRAVVHEQSDIIIRQQAEILLLKLEYARWGRGIIENFLIAMDNPDTELRDILIEALRDFDDEVARLEEHAPA